MSPGRHPITCCLAALRDPGRAGPVRGLLAPAPSMLLAFHKPYGVLSQFTPEPGSRHATLAGFGFPPGVYPLGRLDADSEGLLLLSDEAAWNQRLLHPDQGHVRRYWVQVEGEPGPAALERLAAGVAVRGRSTRPARAWLLDPAPAVPPRQPPVRVRRNVPDRWVALELTEGKNRQVRRMTAAVGHPTLRLIRVQVGAFPLGALAPGCWAALDPADQRRVLAAPPSLCPILGTKKY